MSASQAASLSLLLSAAAAQRALPQDGQQQSGGGWQQAFQAAAQGDEAGPRSVVEAARLLALGNLAMAAVRNAPLPVAAHEVTADGEHADPVRTAQAARAPSMPASDVRGASTVPAARPAATANSSSPAADGAHDDSTVARPAPLGAAGVTDEDLPGRSSSDRYVGPKHFDEITPPVAVRPHLTEVMAARQAVASYAAAMSASASSDHVADFSLISRSSTLPVRVHVQWRDRVADIWIGLHRQAYDQLPDIRAGVEDWVVSRGGVLGHVVCNGEALARVAPSVSFLGAL